MEEPEPWVRRSATQEDGDPDVKTNSARHVRHEEQRGRSSPSSDEEIVRRTVSSEGGSYYVFLSHKEEDFCHAKLIYDLLERHGVRAFLSELSLPRMGESAYMRSIDEALEQAEHMILVTSSVENATSKWVEAEWRAFINELRSDRKSGNFLTVVAGDVAADTRPISIRQYEVIPVDADNLEEVLTAYVC